MNVEVQTVGSSTRTLIIRRGVRASWKRASWNFESTYESTYESIYQSYTNQEIDHFAFRFIQRISHGILVLVVLVLLLPPPLLLRLLLPPPLLPPLLLVLMRMLTLVTRHRCGW
jgi:hypothetical protein